jgi:hypothetical protein
MSSVVNFFTKVGNWISFKLSFLEDAEVREYTRAEAVRLELERQQAEADAEAAAAAKEQATAVDDKAKGVSNKAKKSVFKGAYENSARISSMILAIFWYLAPYFIVLYAGSITSNWLIGYSAPMRFFAFSFLVLLYLKVPLATVAFSILYIIKFIFYNQLIMKEIAPYYSWLPLVEYDDSEWKRFIPFFWKSTPLSRLKQKVVHEQYKNAFEINMNTGTIPPKPYEDALAVCIEVGRLFGKQGFSRTVAAIKSAEIQLDSLRDHNQGYSKDELQSHVDPIMQASKVPATPAVTQ